MQSSMFLSMLLCNADSALALYSNAYIWISNFILLGISNFIGKGGWGCLCWAWRNARAFWWTNVTKFDGGGQVGQKRKFWRHVIIELSLHGIRNVWEHLCFLTDYHAYCWCLVVMVKVDAYFHDKFTSISWNFLQIYDSYYYNYKRQKYYSKIHPPFSLY